MPHIHQCRKSSAEAAICRQFGSMHVFDWALQALVLEVFNDECRESMTSENVFVHPPTATSSMPGTELGVMIIAWYSRRRFNTIRLIEPIIQTKLQELLPGVAVEVHIQLFGAPQ